jgi:hypothetical protein
MGGGGDGGGGGTIDPGCIPSLLPEAASVPAECGIFVKAGATGSGTRTDPTGDLAQAMVDVSNGKAVYVCGADAFTGTFALAGGRSVFGGLACDWTYVATTRPRLMGVADVPALIVSGSGTTKLEDFDVVSPDAVAAGASSIGVMIDSTTVDLARVNVEAGDGAAGAAGANQPQTNNLVGANGSPGVNACVSATQNAGGAQVVTDCGGTPSIGGKGGDGNGPNGGDGSDGQTGTFGAGGVGQPVMGPWSCAVGVGGGGDNGSPGSPGSPGSGKGVLASTGFVGAVGGAGGSGTPGQGGGGGGGSKGTADCDLVTPGNQAGAGASGGSGGAGGCGGTGAAGGGGGGASFALVALNADVSVIGSTLTSGAGGAGGTGGAGQPGAGGGNPGFGGSGAGPVVAACAGGFGGSGGAGGGGGGGRGGHSAAIVFSGMAPEIDGESSLSGGSFGAGGTGVGNGLDPGNNGLSGSACGVMDFSAAAEVCTAM